MKYHNPNNHIHELPIGKFQHQPNSTRKLIFLVLFFITLTTLPLYLRSYTNSPLRISLATPDDNDDDDHHQGTCNLFNGTWVPHSGGPYYTNETCNQIIDQQNCLKFGRTDREFLKWRWKPDGCDLPLFDAIEFLELVKGKSLAFLGDSVGKNQMHSLVCLLATAGYPEDVSERYYNDTMYFKRYIYHNYNFTVGTLWAPFLVQHEESDPNGYSLNSLISLYLDEPSDGWSHDVAGFDYVVVSAGQWFLGHPVMLYENRSLLGCTACGHPGVPNLTPYYAYRKAFHTVFNSLLRLQNYKGVTILRTFSPGHFEKGAWNTGGSCPRTRPFRQDVEAPYLVREMHRAQVEEFEEARELANKRGLDFRIMDTTGAMFMRPDGHPNFYGHSPDTNISYNDCVHWCLPGPIDTWNEIFLHMFRTLNNSRLLQSDGKL